LHTIKEDGGFARAEKIKGPVAPALREATVAKDRLKAVPIDRVKCFVEVELKYNSRSRPMEIDFYSNQIGSCEILR
jgi:hypothetical protein